MEIAIGLIVIFLAWSYLKARARIHYANKLQVERLTKEVDAPYPSWAANKNRME